MNRIILIGNGFDLAHGLKTSYNDFIDDYWKDAINDIQKHSVRTIFESQEIIIDRIPWKWTWEGDMNYQSLLTNLKNNQCKITFKNRFLEIISEQKDIQNWVDIEDEYYILLKVCIKHETSGYPITRLNNDFHCCPIKQY